MANLLANGDFRTGSVDVKVGNGAGTVATSTAAIGSWALNVDETDVATNKYIRIRNIGVSAAVAASKVTEPPQEVIGDSLLLVDMESGPLKPLGTARTGFAEVQQSISSSPKALANQIVELNLFVYSVIAGTFGVNIANVNIYASGTVSTNILQEAVQLQAGWNRVRRVFLHPNVLDTDPTNGAYTSGSHIVTLNFDQGIFSNVSINVNTTVAVTGVYFGLQLNAEFNRVEEIVRAKTIALADASVANGVPAGGTTGQVLEKNSSADFDSVWSNLPAIHNVPSGGTAGQVLKKNSGTDFDANFSNILGTGSESTTTGTIALDLTPGKEIDTVVLTGNPTFNTANRANGLFKSIRIDSNGSSRTIAFNASWTWLGTDNSAGVTLASGKKAVLSLTCYGTAETDIVAVYSAQP